MAIYTVERTQKYMLECIHENFKRAIDENELTGEDLIQAIQNNKVEFVEEYLNTILDFFDEDEL